MELQVCVLAAKLTDLTVPAAEVRLAPAHVRVHPVFTHAFVLTGGGDTLIAVCKPVKEGFSETDASSPQNLC